VKAFTVPETHISGFLLLTAEANKGVAQIVVHRGGVVIPTDQIDGTEDVSHGVDLDGITFGSSNGAETPLALRSHVERHGAFSSR
jgi:hypothetical protein